MGQVCAVCHVMVCVMAVPYGALRCMSGVHYNDVTMGAMASQINRLFKAQIKENFKAPRHWPLCVEFTGGPVNSPHKGPVTRKMFPFDDVIIIIRITWQYGRMTNFFKNLKVQLSRMKTGSILFANLQNINSNSNSNSGGFNSNSNSNSGDFNSNSNSNSGVSNPTPTPFQIQSILFN